MYTAVLGNDKIADMIHNVALVHVSHSEKSAMNKNKTN